MYIFVTNRASLAIWRTFTGRFARCLAFIQYKHLLLADCSIGTVAKDRYDPRCGKWNELLNVISHAQTRIGSKCVASLRLVRALPAISPPIRLILIARRFCKLRVPCRLLQTNIINGSVARMGARPRRLFQSPKSTRAFSVQSLRSLLCWLLSVNCVALHAFLIFICGCCTDVANCYRVAKRW